MDQRDFELDTSSGEVVLKVRARGRLVLLHPMVNRGTAFTLDERRQLGLSGLLPSGVTTLDQQVRRSYSQFSRYTIPLSKNIYLSDLRDRNEVLFYRLLTEHLEEMLPIVYTPTIGEVIERFSDEFHGARAVYCSIDRPELIEQNLRDYGLGGDEVDLVVVTDSGGILGIGDQGIGGVQIAIGKLGVYTAAAGIHPRRAVPVVLDVGTDNLELLSSDMYLGEAHTRVTGPRYDAFIERFVNAVTTVFPHALLHWEDFGANTAHRLLARYKERCCCFNDDIQGTAAVVLAGVMAAVRFKGAKLADQRIVIYGAGTAGTGVADIIRAAMVREGVPVADTYDRFYSFNSRGLIVSGGTGMRDFQVPYARGLDEVRAWGVADPYAVGLAEAMPHMAPTILIGTSARAGSFTEPVVRAMAAGCDHPIIMPLSNPTSKSEATPEELLHWTDGRALIATGSPFPDVEYGGAEYTIAQANNALIFPGLGLGVSVVGARRVTDSMIYAAAAGLAGLANEYRPGAGLLPSIRNLKLVSSTVAIAVAEAAIAEGVATTTPDDLIGAVYTRMWKPRYPKLEILEPLSRSVLPG